MRELVLDTETTGLDPNDNHRIIELACVEIINFIPTGRTWHWYFNPERDVPKTATDVHGITSAFLADKPLFGALVDEIHALLTSSKLIIHNAAFDVGFLNHEFNRLGRSKIGFENVVDTLALSRRRHPGSPSTLDALCRRYGIDNSARTKHGALLDCELLADVYLKLMNAEQAGLDFSTPLHIVEDGAKAVVFARPNPLPSRFNAADLEAHAAFVASLGPSAVWLDYAQRCQVNQDKAAA